MVIITILLIIFQYYMVSYKEVQLENQVMNNLTYNVHNIITGLCFHYMGFETDFLVFW